MKYAVLHKVTGRCGFATLPTAIHLSLFQMGFRCVKRDVIPRAESRG